jgi:predicted DNA-binding protein
VKQKLKKSRTNIYLSEDQMAKLKKLSQRTLAPVAALVRQAVDEYLVRRSKEN